MITQEAVRLYRALRALPRHGHHDERIRLELSLHAALGLQPWHPHISDVTTAEPPANDATTYGQTWPHVWKLRRQLEEEIKAADAKKRAREQRYAVASDPSRLAGRIRDGSRDHLVGSK
jgi:hypothetical protein